MIRPAKLGMKNWMFFGSLEAGTNNALIYTLLANCGAQDIDPEDCLIEVIRRLPHDATPEQASSLTPACIASERRAALDPANAGNRLKPTLAPPPNQSQGDEFRTLTLNRSAGSKKGWDS
jgi:hypothetical protein